MELQLLYAEAVYRGRRIATDFVPRQIEYWVSYRGIHLDQCFRQIKEHAYLYLVRPQLEQSNFHLVHTLKGYKTIDSVQRRAARFTLNNYGRTSTVKEMTVGLNWDSLENRRKWNDSVFFFQ